MTFMIVASPCAVVLATMPPLLAAIANAGRHGVLVKSAVVMEQLGQSTLVAFDKTGTLTEGTPRVAEVAVLPGLRPGRRTRLLALAAAAEHPSEHPLARAVVARRPRARPRRGARRWTSRPRPVAASRGGGGARRRASGPVAAGRAGRGLRRPASPTGVGQAADAAVTALEAAGRTAVVVSVDDVPVGRARPRRPAAPGAAATVAALASSTGSRADPAHRRQRARRRAGWPTEVGITDVRAGLLPGGQGRAVRALQEQGHRVLLVGDGVNDAPALAAAHLGVAMGRRGSDLALETADAIVVRDDLATLPGRARCRVGRTAW